MELNIALAFICAATIVSLTNGNPILCEGDDCCISGYTWCNNIQRCCQRCDAGHTCFVRQMTHSPSTTNTKERQSLELNDDAEAATALCPPGYNVCAYMGRCCPLGKGCSVAGSCFAIFPVEHHKMLQSEDATTCAIRGGLWCGDMGLPKCCNPISGCNSYECTKKIPLRHPQMLQVNDDNDDDTKVVPSSGPQCYPCKYSLSGCCPTPEECTPNGCHARLALPPGVARKEEQAASVDEETYESVLDTNKNEKEMLPFEEQIEFE